MDGRYVIGERDVVAWAADRRDVLAVALAGSHARGAARPDSDVDVMLVVEEPERYVVSREWVEAFGTVEAVAVEGWGAVTSLRVQYDGGPEVEFGLTSPAWAATDPVDRGTARVVLDGFRILHDPAGLLARLVRAVI